MVAVVLTPLVVTWLALFGDRDWTAEMHTNVDAAARSVASGTAVEEAARRSRARVRVISATGDVTAHADHEAPTSLRDWLGDLFVGPAGAPRLDDWEAVAPQPGNWPEVVAARRGVTSSRCFHALEGRLAICVAALPMAEGRVVLVERSSPRSIRALYDLRYPLLKLTLGVLLTGLVLTAWLTRTILGPLEKLRSDVVARAQKPRRTSRIAVPARDELGDLAASFDLLVRNLDERARQNENFTADLVHELKNPVAAVRACAEALEGPGPIEEARARRLAQALSASGRRLDALVTRFLELARAEAGLVGEARERVDVAALARGLAAAVAADARYAAVNIAVASDGSCVVTGVPSRLESAVLNVVENAASFAGAGGRVDVRVARDGDSVELLVRDSGPGIAAENLERVFERFFTTRSEGRGTGLGLAMSRAVAEAHGGTLVAESSYGHGATFKFRLPSAV
jgi:two-component system sensor histidine kinase ChvG